jgi:hypothetical protein
MALLTDVKIKVESTRLCLIFFPFATFTKINDVSLLSVLTIPVYRRAGKLKTILGFNYAS